MYHNMESDFVCSADEICYRYRKDKKSESPKSSLRAFDKSFANTRKLKRLISFYYVFRLFAIPEASLFVFTSNLVSSLWHCFLCLSVLLEWTGLLLWWMPCRRNTKKSPWSSKAIPPDCQREKSPPWSWKPPSTWFKQKRSKKHGWYIFHTAADMVYANIILSGNCHSRYQGMVWQGWMLTFLRILRKNHGWISSSRLWQGRFGTSNDMKIQRRWNMIKKHPINPQRARRIAGSFAFIEQKFLE